MGRLIQTDCHLNLFMDECTVTFADQSVQQMDNMFVNGGNITLIS